MASDPDIRFYTGLPDYQTFFKTKTRLLAELLRWIHKCFRDHLYFVPGGRPQRFRHINELFLIMTRLRLGLMEDTSPIVLTLFIKRSQKYLPPGSIECWKDTQTGTNWQNYRMLGLGRHPCLWKTAWTWQDPPRLKEIRGKVSKRMKRWVQTTTHQALLGQNVVYRGYCIDI